jgi:hypothetical protein
MTLVIRNMIWQLKVPTVRVEQVPAVKVMVVLPSCCVSYYYYNHFINLFVLHVPFVCKKKCLLNFRKMVRRKIDDIKLEELLMNVPSDIDTPYEDRSDEESTDENVGQPNVSSTYAAHDISSESEHDKSPQLNVTST